MPGRTWWRSAWLPFAGWLVVVFGLSSIPDFGPPEAGLPLADKVAHLGEYAVLGALFARARPGRRAGRALLAGLVLGLVTGALDEAWQSRTPGRETSGFDALADTLGAGLGSLAMSLWASRRSRPGPADPVTRSSREGR